MTAPPPDPRRGRLDRTSSIPLWQQLLGDLRARMVTGEFVGEFPGELALVEQYGVSRHTVREALRELRDDGVVTAARGRRPQLLPVDASQVAGSLSGLVALGGRSALAGGRWNVRVRELRADGVVAARMGLEESSPLLHLERVLLVDHVPLLLDRAWFDGTLGRPLLDVDLTGTTLYEELASHCGVRLTQAREHLQARVADRGEQAALQLSDALDSPVIAVQRTGCCEGRPVEHRRTVVRADRCALALTYDRGRLIPSSPSPDDRSTS